MNISTSISDESEGLTLASIMDITEGTNSDSTGYSSVTDVLTSYDADGNVAGYTYTTNCTDADGSSYSWIDSYDENWNLTQSAYSDSTGYSTVTDILTSYDADGNVVGHTYSTDVTDADGASYSWTNSYDKDWNLTQSAYSDGSTSNSMEASESDVGNEVNIMDDYADDFVFNAEAENTDIDTTDTYLVDDAGQYDTSSDLENQSPSDAFVYDCNVYVGDTVSLPDNSFI